MLSGDMINSKITLEDANEISSPMIHVLIMSYSEQTDI